MCPSLNHRHRRWASSLRRHTRGREHTSCAEARCAASRRLGSISDYGSNVAKPAGRHPAATVADTAWQQRGDTTRATVRQQTGRRRSAPPCEPRTAHNSRAAKQAVPMSIMLQRAAVWCQRRPAAVAPWLAGLAACAGCASRRSAAPSSHGRASPTFGPTIVRLSGPMSGRCRAECRGAECGDASRA